MQPCILQLKPRTVCSLDATQKLILCAQGNPPQQKRSLGLMHLAYKPTYYQAALFSLPLSRLAIIFLWQIDPHPPRRQPCPLILIHHTPNARIISFQQGRIHPLSRGVSEIFLSLCNLLCHCGLMVAAIGGGRGGERAANALLNWGGRRERPLRDFAYNGPV